ncbi:MAG: 50S ribosomal protein L29 [Acidobacteriota bacterium]
MKLEEIRQMSLEDLKAREGELTEQIFRSRFKRSLGEVDATKQVRANKKELARVKTILREHELNINR